MGIIALKDVIDYVGKLDESYPIGLSNIRGDLKQASSQFKCFSVGTIEPYSSSKQLNERIIL